ncbi:MAG: radical SAM protein [Candidatus Omnitrophica bacterium]|nr:radical SAM protein [Candidatus Omnitrophota bacterium]
MEEFDKLIRDKNKLLVIAGIMHSAKAFVGPEVLHIDLTNWCNFNCIACWCRSPLLKDKAMPDWEKKLIIPFDLIKKVFDDLEQMGGLRQVKLVGGGEPFMHPDILNIVKYIKGKDKTIEIDINTNFSLVTEEMAAELLEVGLDSFTVSLWAGTPGAYAAVHPNQNESTFKGIEKVLKFISAKKKEHNWFHPRIIIHDVIFNRNYRDIEEMVKFALEVGASNIQFVPVDTVKDRTEELLLNDKERLELLEALQRIRKHYDPQSFDYTSEDARVVKLPDFDGFIRRIERQNLASGAYDEDVVEEIPCYVGWLFARIMTTGSVVPCCKGHRMSMGNIYKNSFKEIWLSDTYNEFRKKCLVLVKSDPYFSKIGNDAVAKTGCYNCDNLWQNIPMHKKITSLKSKNEQLVSFCSCVLKNIF